MVQIVSNTQSEEFSLMLKILKSDLHMELDFNSYLIKPIQRLAKYPTFFEALCREECINMEEYEDIELVKCRYNGVILYINEFKKRIEGTTGWEWALEKSPELKEKCNEICTGDYITHGNFKDSGKPFTAYFFTKMLLIFSGRSEKKFKLKEYLDVSSMLLFQSPGTDSLQFVIEDAARKKFKKVFKSSEMYQKNIWISLIKTVIEINTVSNPSINKTFKLHGIEEGRRIILLSQMISESTEYISRKRAQSNEIESIHKRPLDITFERPYHSADSFESNNEANQILRQTITYSYENPTFGFYNEWSKNESPRFMDTTASSLGKNLWRPQDESDKIAIANNSSGQSISDTPPPEIKSIPNGNLMRKIDDSVSHKPQKPQLKNEAEISNSKMNSKRPIETTRSSDSHHLKRDRNERKSHFRKTQDKNSSRTSRHSVGSKVISKDKSHPDLTKLLTFKKPLANEDIVEKAQKSLLERFEDRFEGKPKSSSRTHEKNSSVPSEHRSQRHSSKNGEKKNSSNQRRSHKI